MINSIEMKERITSPQQKLNFYWVNVSKVIGIYLMILGHRNLVDNQMTQFIFSFHMPLFFMMSGMLYHPKTLRESFDKILRSLITPFLIMTLFWVLFYIVCVLKNHLPLSTIWQYAIGSIISPGHDFLMFHPLCVYLWFIMALAIIRSLATLGRSKTGVGVISTILFLIGIVLIKHHIQLPFALNSVFLAIPFFAIGYMFSQFFTRKYSNIVEIACLLTCVVAVIIIGLFNERVDINNNEFGNNIILYLICGIAGSLAVFSLSKLFCVKIPYESSLINVLSRGTLLMVGFSATLSSMYISIIDNNVSFISIDSNVIGMITGLLVLISFYPLTILVDRYFPAIIGFRK